MKSEDRKQKTKRIKWEVDEVTYEYGNEFKFDDYLNNQIKILAQGKN